MHFMIQSLYKFVYWLILNRYLENYSDFLKAHPGTEEFPPDININAVFPQFRKKDSWDFYEILRICFLQFIICN